MGNEIIKGVTFGAFFSLLCWLMIAYILTGCSGSTGWRVSFGVSPVTGIEETQEHNKNKAKQEKY